LAGAGALGAAVRRRYRRGEGRCQLFSGDPGSRCYIVQSIPGKGAGAVATRPLTAGELLAEEEPLLQWSGEDQDQVQQLFDALPLHKQSAMMDLQDSYAHNDAKKTLLGVVCTNSFTFQNEEDERCLYLEISRFNHSCRPNCEGSWDDRLGLLQVYACEDIPSGDELCLFYTDVRKPRQLRQEKLQTLGFTCACPVCRAADPASDKRRERLWQLVEEIPSCEDPEQALGLIRESFELSDAEGLNISCFREVAAYQAYTSCLSMGCTEEAGKWIQRAYEFSLKGHGPYHATTKIVSRHASRYRS
ncbi:set5, partial [Symbiodinium sp. KB8]